jgi:hypothetical protein
VDAFTNEPGALRVLRAIGRYMWTGLILLGHWNLVAWPMAARSAEQEDAAYRAASARRPVSGR